MGVQEAPRDARGLLAYQLDDAIEHLLATYQASAGEKMARERVECAIASHLDVPHKYLWQALDWSRLAQAIGFIARLRMNLLEQQPTVVHRYPLSMN